MSYKLNFFGFEIMFFLNNMLDKEYVYVCELGVIINLDVFEDIEYLECAVGILEIIFCCYNFGGVFELGIDIMDNFGEVKFGMIKDQFFEVFVILKEKGVKIFGIYFFLVFNIVIYFYYLELVCQFFELVVEIKEKLGILLDFINFFGGIGVNYCLDQELNDIVLIGEGVCKVYEEVFMLVGFG